MEYLVVEKLIKFIKIIIVKMYTNMYILKLVYGLMDMIVYNMILY